MVANANRVLVLEKAWQILSLFTLEQPEHDLRSIRTATGLPPTTCSRIVRNLVAAGILVEHDDRYRVGLSVVHWAEVALADIDVLDLIRPVLKELRDETGETAGFFVREEADRVCVAFAESSRPIGRRLSLGHTLPLNVGSPGKVLLAFDPDAPRALDGRLASFTERTIDTRAALETALAEVRREGYAYSFGEWSPEVGGVAAPVFEGGDRLVGAIALSAPVARIDAGRAGPLRDAVVETAARVSAALALRAAS